MVRAEALGLKNSLNTDGQGRLQNMNAVCVQIHMLSSIRPGKGPSEFNTRLHWSLYLQQRTCESEKHGPGTCSGEFGTFVCFCETRWHETHVLQLRLIRCSWKPHALPWCFDLCTISERQCFTLFLVLSRFAGFLLFDKATIMHQTENIWKRCNFKCREENGAVQCDIHCGLSTLC